RPSIGWRLRANFPSESDWSPQSVSRGCAARSRHICGTSPTANGLPRRKITSTRLIRGLSPAQSEAGRPRRISPLIQIANSRLPAQHQGETMSEEDNSLHVSNQLVGNDQPIEG